MNISAKWAPPPRRNRPPRRRRGHRGHAGSRLPRPHAESETAVYLSADEQNQNGSVYFIRSKDCTKKCAPPRTRRPCDPWISAS